MIWGNPSFKCQRVWFQIRPTFDKSIGTELKGLIAVACSSSHARVREFLSGKLQVCKVLGGGVHYFAGGPLANFYGNLYDLYVVFKGMKVRNPCLHSDLHMLLL